MRKQNNFFLFMSCCICSKTNCLLCISLSLVLRFTVNTLAMEEYKQEYLNLRKQLETEMYNFGLLVGTATEEDMEASCTALESINDSCRKLLAQIELYHAFVKLKINIKEMSLAIPKLYG